MKKERIVLTSRRLYNIRAQGYCGYTDSEISKLAFGNRFTYYLCSFLLLIGVMTANIPLLSIMMVVALFGVILPNHLFDYIYNIFLSKPLNKPKLPPRSKQLKFACSIATVWLAGTIYLFYLDYIIAGYISGGFLFSISFLLSITDICIPSIIYNFLFKYKVR